MKWSMDTHKYISEVTRKALKVLFEKNITSESSAEEIDAAEHILADENVYKVIITEEAIKEKKQPELLRLAENETRPAIKVKKAKKKKGVETA